MNNPEHILKSGIALTGGIASGKSTIGRILTQLGQKVIDADKLSRQVVEKNSPALLQIKDEFGQDIIDQNGLLNRTKLREIIFSHPDKKDKLEKIMHPAIQNLLIEQVLSFQSSSPHSLWFYEIPLLFETKQEEKFLEVWMTTCPINVQIQRVTKRDSTSPEQALAIIQTQLPNEYKESRANFIIDSTQSYDNISNSIQERLNKLRNDCMRK